MGINAAKFKITVTSVCRRFCAAARQAMQLDRARTLRLVVVIVDQNVGARHINENKCDVSYWPETSVRCLAAIRRSRCLGISASPPTPDAFDPGCVKRG